MGKLCTAFRKGYLSDSWTGYLRSIPQQHGELLKLIWRGLFKQIVS